MLRQHYFRSLGVSVVIAAVGGFAVIAALGVRSASAQEDNRYWSPNPYEIKHVFVIALENHNWTQPTSIPGGIQPVYQNSNAPFINSLVNGTALVYFDGRLNNISKQVSYATAYHNVLATPSGNNLHIHPSEPNYLWAEAGTNFGILNDNDPYKDNPPNAQNTTQHLSGLLQRNGKTWKSYQEDIDLQTDAGGHSVNLPLPENQWTVPLLSLSGIFAPESPVNTYNDYLSIQLRRANTTRKSFFTDTNGGNNTTTRIRLSQQLRAVAAARNSIWRKTA